MRFTLLYILIALCFTGCAQSHADRTIEEIATLIERGDVQQLDSLRMTLLLNPGYAREVVAHAEKSHSRYHYGITLGVALEPEEAAQTFVNWIELRTIAATDTVKHLFSVMTNTAAMLRDPDNYAVLTTSIDSYMMRLPIDRRAHVLAVSSNPRHLGRQMRLTPDKALTEAIKSEYAADSTALAAFTKALNN